jgi:hypothetical protein
VAGALAERLRERLAYLWRTRVAGIEKDRRRPSSTGFLVFLAVVFTALSALYSGHQAEQVRHSASCQNQRFVQLQQALDSRTKAATTANAALAVTLRAERAFVVAQRTLLTAHPATRAEKVAVFHQYLTAVQTRIASIDAQIAALHRADAVRKQHPYPSVAAVKACRR